MYGYVRNVKRFVKKMMEVRSTRFENILIWKIYKIKIILMNLLASSNRI